MKKIKSKKFDIVIKMDDEGNFRCPRTHSFMTVGMCLNRQEKKFPGTRGCLTCKIPHQLTKAKEIEPEKSTVKLRHMSTVRNPNGVFEIEVVILNTNPKKYTYCLTSDWAVRRFTNYLKKGKEFHGRALAVLNQWKIKFEEDEA